ncbi:MAG: aminopeptidase P family protein [Chloroflexaceae bacterium]|nr:aminopeptidase P family protein [Chloroflexaceae bacterium]
MHERLGRLRALFSEHELDALLITSTDNRRYFSGFTGSAGALLIMPQQALLLTDFRYRTQSLREAPAFERREISAKQPLTHTVAEIARELGLHCLGFEADDVSVALFEKLRDVLQEAEDAPGTALCGLTDGGVDALREVKEDAELALLRQAIAITDAALAAVLPALRPEQTERQAAWMLEGAMRERGADGISFPIIVAAGTNAALPHARPTDACLGTHQPIIIDMGASYQGYHADLTRTVVLGEPDARFWQVYQVVLDAQEHAITHIYDGIATADADALARDCIEEAGFGESFGHSLGHGVGLNVHEGPRLSARDKKTLHVGMVFSLEPGIYLPDWGGVRIEDLVLLQPTGVAVLSQAPKMPHLSYHIA